MLIDDDDYSDDDDNESDSDDNNVHLDTLARILQRSTRDRICMHVCRVRV